ncbi:hypothetical protein [Sphingobacterium yanglingense]|uniref:Very-short-patch-repair endonuclease n=1 Tax=Sphingobacterium yanglingense TaxID=1437280 RepID=A0A4R6WKT8_9SPHI|nr:hypothetical protein [Sphingobacterium yanglingense]TDQ79557.1 hypothetical protein CLV99_1000 [Sphingobacterium yanglingense]
MAKSNWGTAFAKNLKQNGWVEVNGVIKRKNNLTEEEKVQICISTAKKKHNRSTGLKTAWIDDYRNLRNKEHQKDLFIQFIKQELGLEVWPEFYFTLDRQFRIDYAIPLALDGSVMKIAIEQEGGIWMKGNSGHSSGTGIKRDMEKGNLLQSLGWKLIRRQPSEMLSMETLGLIQKILF